MKYYIANAEYSDSIYGDQEPVCIDLNEVKRLSREWGISIEDLLNQMHEADESEISKYGVYNG